MGDLHTAAPSLFARRKRDVQSNSFIRRYLRSAVLRAASESTVRRSRSERGIGCTMDTRYSIWTYFPNAT